MQITIKNFGPIKEFNYDLSKDIIVTFGNNNIGKSYAMQVVYLLLKNLIEYAEFGSSYYHYRYYSQLRMDSEYFTEKEKVQKFAKETKPTEKITEIINSAVVRDISTKLVTNFIHSCENTFGNFKGILAQKPVIIMHIERYTLTIDLAQKAISNATVYTVPTYLKRASSDFHKSRNANGHLDIYYYNNIDAPMEIIMECVSNAIVDFSTNVRLAVGNVYFLPASRSGIYSGMSAFSSIIAELSKNKAMLTRKIELPGISEPISDYFLMLSNIKARENELVSAVYQKIEDEILHGKVSFNRSKNTLMYTPEGIKHEFEMTEVSSMVSEISPIVAFLKYVVSSRDKRQRMQFGKPILFIEEPEAHLHPMNQIKLIELFAQLNKFGIKIIISSHSNYVFNKLNNLLLKKDINPQVYSAILLQMEGDGSVSANMPIDELGVDDTNFMDVTEYLYNEREQLILEWTEE